MKANKVVLAGGGVLGAQIAFQSAFCGKDVTIWLRSEGSIERAKPRIEELHKTYLAELENLDNLKGKVSNNFPRGFVDNTQDLTEEDIKHLKEKIDAAYENVKYELDLGKAVSGAHFIIEAVAENVEEKQKFYGNLSEVVDDETIILSNSSTFLPSFFVQYLKNPERFLNFHFANKIWRNNTAEVMGHKNTDKKCIEETVELAKEIRMVPLLLNKEQPGYLLNSLLVPLLDAGLKLWANDVASVEDIDKAWKLGTGAPVGPFGIIDVVGLRTVYNIHSNEAEAKNPDSIEAKVLTKLKVLIDEGKIGVEAGEGFYSYKK